MLTSVGGGTAGLGGLLAVPAVRAGTGAGLGGCCGVKVLGERCRGVPPSSGVLGGGCQGCVTKRSQHGQPVSGKREALSHSQSIAHKNIHNR